MKKTLALVLGLMLVSMMAHAADVEVLMKNCNKDGKTACLKAGKAYLGANETGKARSAFNKGCDTNEWESCGQLAFLLSEGKGGPSTPKQVVEAATKACDHKDGLGCAVLGGLHETGKGVGKDPAKTASLYKKACANNCGMGCMKMGDLLAGGKCGQTKNLGKALEQYKDGCKKGCGEACFEASKMIGKGEGGPANPIDSAKLKKEACDKGHKPACK